MRNVRVFAFAIAAVGLFATSTVDAKDQLVIYTAASEELHAEVVKAFQSKYPDIEVKTENASTGPTAARAIAEKSNPQADVVYAVNSFYLEQLKNEGVFEPYEPQSSEILAEFRDPDGFYVSHWLTLMVYAVNTKIATERGLAVPTTWDDLAKPDYKGLVSVAAPTKSGTGLTIFTSLLDAYGWDYLDKLDANIAKYNDGGGAAGRQAGAGEVMIGLTYDTPVLEQIKAGLPVEMVLPKPTPNVTEGGGLVSGAPHPEQGKLFLDFAASRQGAEIYQKFVGATTTPGIANVDVSQATLYKMTKPVDIEAFKREWAERYEH